MKKKKKVKEVKWNSGINSKSTMSYEKYIKAGLENISKNLSVRTYKLAPKADYPFFERGTDLRVQIYWKKESKYEFIVEQAFWYRSNTNKEDRSWMRSHADCHLKVFHDAVERGKEEYRKKNSSKKKTAKKATKKTVKKAKVGATQAAFEKMKKSKK